MQGFPRRLVRPLFVVLACVILTFAARAAGDEPLTKEENPVLAVPFGG